MTTLRKEVLHKHEAEHRAKAVKGGVDYDVLLNLCMGGDSYEVACRISFNLHPDWKELNNAVFLDFNGKEIKTMKVNGIEMETPRIDDMWRENKIYIETAFLKDGVTNLVEFIVDNQFNKDQFGMILSKDTDGGEYTFIQTVPYYASRILPMFDQPDLKGKFLISVIHPENDICITTGLQTQQRKLSEVTQKQTDLDWWDHSTKCFRIDDEKSVMSCFEATPYLSSYLLNLVCGPLACVEATEAQTHNGIKMRIFCRSNLFI